MSKLHQAAEAAEMGAVGLPCESLLKHAAPELGGGRNALLGGHRHAHICRPELLALRWVSCFFGVKPAFETLGNPLEQRGDWEL